MKYTVSLLGLSTTVAISLLLPTQAQADTLTLREETQGEPAAALTHEAPQLERGLEGMPAVETIADVPTTDLAATDIAATDEAEAINSVVEAEVVEAEVVMPAATAEVVEAEVVMPAATAADANQGPQPAPVIVIEPGETRQAQDEALLPLPASTDSRDLQAIAAPSPPENSFLTPLAQTLDIAQTPSESSQRWHFLVVPYIYVPFNISGSVTFEGSEDFTNDFDDPSVDFDFSPSEIVTSLQNSLNFAFLGGLEAWTPDYNIGILANLDYASLSSEETVNRSVLRPGFADFVPTELNAEVDTELWRVDLAGGYRFYDAANVNPEGVYSEYDLGPFVFDVFGGLSLLSINADLDLSTNLGGEGESSRSQTIISPLIGGRVRWNATPKLAVVGLGSISGFGISGLTQYSVQGWVEWMFSGNTSLAAGYRFSFLDYSADRIDLNVDQNGPYLNIGFRF